MSLEIDKETRALLDGMNPEISNLMVRMMEPHERTWESTWESRNAIVKLNEIAKTEEEQLFLCFAFHALMDEAEQRGLIDPISLGKFKAVRKADYLMMLNVQAMVGDLIDPSKLEHVTRREVEAGRLDADDEFSKLAVAAGEVLGKGAPKNRNWLQRLFGSG